MGTKADPGAFDCYSNAELEEPMFVLLARDPLAPMAVFLWAEKYRERKLLEGTGGLTDQQQAKYTEALKCAKDMAKWYDERQKTEVQP